MNVTLLGLNFKFYLSTGETHIKKHKRETFFIYYKMHQINRQIKTKTLMREVEACDFVVIWKNYKNYILQE